MLDTLSTNEQSRTREIIVTIANKAVFFYTVVVLVFKLFIVILS